MLTLAHNAVKYWYKCVNCGSSTLPRKCRKQSLTTAYSFQFKRRCIVKKKHGENGQILEFGDNEQT